MMEAWTSVLQEYSTNSTGKIQDCALQIFQTFVQYHLSPPDGFRQNQDNDTIEIEDNEDIDRIWFKDQLQTIGMFGRIVPSHSLPIIFK